MSLSNIVETIHVVADITATMATAHVSFHRKEELATKIRAHEHNAVKHPTHRKPHIFFHPAYA